MLFFQASSSVYKQKQLLKAPKSLLRKFFLINSGGVLGWKGIVSNPGNASEAIWDHFLAFSSNLKKSKKSRILKFFSAKVKQFIKDLSTSVLKKVENFFFQKQQNKSKKCSTNLLDMTSDYFKLIGHVLGTHG